MHLKSKENFVAALQNEAIAESALPLDLKLVAACTEFLHEGAALYDDAMWLSCLERMTFFDIHNCLVAGNAIVIAVTD